MMLMSCQQGFGDFGRNHKYDEGINYIIGGGWIIKVNMWDRNYYHHTWELFRAHEAPGFFDLYEDACESDPSRVLHTDKTLKEFSKVVRYEFPVNQNTKEANNRIYELCKRIIEHEEQKLCL